MLKEATPADVDAIVEREARAAALALINEPHLGRLWVTCELAEAYCREMGVNAMHLEVERHREGALELYRRRGFEDHNRYLLTKWLG